MVLTQWFDVKYCETNFESYGFIDIYDFYFRISLSIQFCHIICLAPWVTQLI